jgi:hypothetical protein
MCRRSVGCCIAGCRLHQHCCHTQQEPPKYAVMLVRPVHRRLQPPVASRRMRQHQKRVQEFAARADPAGQRAPPRFHAAVARCSSASLMRPPPPARGPGSETGCECSAGVADTGVARAAVPLFASSPRCSAHQLAFAEAGACAAPRFRVRVTSQRPLVPPRDIQGR